MPQRLHNIASIVSAVMDRTFDSVPLAPFPTPSVGDGVPVRTVAVAEADGDEDGDEDTGDEEPTEVEVEPKVAVEVRDPEVGAVIEAETPEAEEDEEVPDTDPVRDVLLVKLVVVVGGAGVTVIVVPKVPVPRGSEGLLMVKNWLQLSLEPNTEVRDASQWLCEIGGGLEAGGTYRRGSSSSQLAGPALLRPLGHQQV